MKAQVEKYIFWKRTGGYDYITEDKRIVFISDTMMECFRRQYTMQGFMTFADNDCFLVFSKVVNEIEIFMERLHGRA